MFSVLVRERSGNPSRLEFHKPEISFGRLDSNDVMLPKDNVSKRHARLMLKEQGYVLFDLQSTNGTYVNGRKISSPVIVQPGDRIQLGDFFVQLETEAEAAAIPSETPPTEPPQPESLPSAAPMAQPTVPPPPPMAGGDPTVPGASPAAPIPAAAAPPPPPPVEPGTLSPPERLKQALGDTMEHLARQMDVVGREQEVLADSSRSHLERRVRELQELGVLSSQLDCDFVIEAATREAIGLGPLDRMLADDRTREIVIDGPQNLFTDTGGGLERAGAFLSSRDALLAVTTRLVERTGSEFDPEQAIQAAELEDGSQVQILLPPVAPEGPLVTVQRVATQAPTLSQLTENGTLSQDMHALLASAVSERKSILVSGGPGSGVSTLLAALGGGAAGTERVVALEARPSSCAAPEGIIRLRRDATQYGLEALFAAAARLRADRLIMDDIGVHDAGSALLAATQTPGSLLGVHAGSVSAALAALDIFVQNSLGGSRAAAASLIAQAIRYAIQVERQGPPGQRVHRIVSISRIDGVDEDVVVAQPLFSYDNGFRRLSIPPPMG
ncbi:MAG: Flp pilus assembly complex ATPase component TadA [Proteobacteria bacterium]|nr:Flp pilus assembly complex ATPase component TadA [Pseudomonadota bacterium]